MTATGVSVEEAKHICSESEKVVREGKEHWYNKFYYVYGRKPEDA